MHKPESILENEMHEIPWDFEIQTDHPIQTRRPDLVLINKKEKKPSNSKFSCCVKKFNFLKAKSLIPGPCQRAEKPRGT